MQLSPRDRRAVSILAGCAVLALLYRFWPESGAQESLPATAAAVELAEKRLAHMRQLVATKPGKVKVLEAVNAQVGEAEKRLLAAETGAQAQAQLLQAVRRVARAQGPPIEIGQVTMSPPQPYGKNYGETVVAVVFRCAVDQLVNLLADLSSQPEMMATNEVHISGADEKQKALQVRLVVSGLMPRKLAPERKGFGLF